MTAVLLGSQVPTYEWVPAFTWSSAAEAIEVGRQAGIDLDQWQQRVMRGALAETDGTDGPVTWLNNEVGLIAPRQNGKGGIIEVRELAGIFAFGERRIMHSAHEFKTAADAFTRMMEIVQSSPDLDRKLIRLSKSKGDEGFTFRVDGKLAELRYFARTGGAGRGFTGVDTVILDEVMILDDPPIAAMLPTMATRPHWQVWYTGSAGDRRLRTESVVLARVRRRGYDQEPGLAFYEWAAHLRHNRECTEGCTLDRRDDEHVWAKTNPSMNRIRARGAQGITSKFIRKMLRIMAEWDFDREFLSVGDYPEPEGWLIFRKDQWEDLEDQKSTRGKAFSVGVEATWDHEHTAFSIASLRDDGRYHAECIGVLKGMAGALDFAEALRPKRPTTFVIDPKGPCGGLADEFERAGLKVTRPTLNDYAAWCERAYRYVAQDPRIRHRSQESMTKAVQGSKKRDVGQGMYVWERQNTSTNVAPWIAFTLALGGVLTVKPRRRPLVAGA